MSPSGPGFSPRCSLPCRAPDATVGYSDFEVQVRSPSATELGRDPGPTSPHAAGFASDRTTGGQGDATAVLERFAPC